MNSSACIFVALYRMFHELRVVDVSVLVFLSVCPAVSKGGHPWPNLLIVLLHFKIALLIAFLPIRV